MSAWKDTIDSHSRREAMEFPPPLLSVKPQSTELNDGAFVRPGPSRTILWLRIAAQAAFGSLIIFDSLFLVLCYTTFDFFGVLNSSLFSWLRECAFLGWLLYFPSFLAALLCLEEKARKLAGVFVVVQFVVGFALLFSQGVKVPLGWCMLYGPNVRTPAGDLFTYIHAIGCLLPLLWLSGTQVATAFRASGRETIADTMNLSSFLLAGTAAALLYAGSAMVRLGSQLFSLATLGFSMAAHLAVFAAIFLVLQWVRVIACRFPNPGLAQFAMRLVAGWLLLVIVIRKIIFALLGFNTHLADLYAGVFSLAVVLLVANLILKVRQAGTLFPASRGSAVSRLNSWPGRACALFAMLALVYLFTVKLASIDWEHVISSVATLAIWALLLWFFFFLGVRRGERSYSWKFLLLFSVGTMAAFAGIKAAELKERWALTVEQYADSDPSFFVIQQALRPALHDEAYSDFYGFLRRHANIPIAVPVRDITLVEGLKPSVSTKPNIFVFVIDALRSDYLSPYNPSVNFTPAIQAFAQESAVFRNAYTPYAGTALAEPAIWAGVQQLHSPYRMPASGRTNLQRMLDIDGYHAYISYDEVLHTIVPASANTTPLGGSSPSQLKEFSAVINELEADLLKSKDPNEPVFSYAQPANLHTLSLALGKESMHIRPHPGFNDKYASSLEEVDKIFGGFIGFLREHGLYDNSIVILTADHGESLGEMGREGHVSNLTPEVIRIPLIIHLPESQQKRGLTWNAEEVVTLHDITPTLYDLLGHRPIKSDALMGRPLFALNPEKLVRPPRDHYFLMSSYLPVFGILSQDQKNLFIVDAMLNRNYYYDLENDPQALRNRITTSLRDHYEPLIRHDLERIDKFYGLTEQTNQ
ncbi:MAG TPA: sulfatase-like hydrolase/transferase [Candidatus Angelobacter sp.]|nr:sulfatase-like hydrolase/transferase [Candidatus Angelobacter sp.]